MVAVCKLILCRILYLEYHSVSPFVRIGSPRPLASVSPLWNRGGGQHWLAGEGFGGSQFGRLKRKPGTLSTLGSLLSDTLSFSV
jgi:hypothetical protein